MAITLTSLLGHDKIIANTTDEGIQIDALDCFWSYKRATASYGDDIVADVVSFIGNQNNLSNERKILLADNAKWHVIGSDENPLDNYITRLQNETALAKAAKVAPKIKPESKLVVRVEQ